MKQIFLALILLTTFALAPLQASPLAVPSAPSIAGDAYVLEDFRSGYVIAEQNADQRVEPASLTKLMTSYVVFAELAAGNIKLEDQVRISEKAWRMPGSRMFIEVNSQVSVEALLMGVIVQSGNDASMALAEFLAGSEAAFAELMNQQASRLGMRGTHFVNSTGLPDAEHYTTARDLAILARALIRDFPEYYAWYRTKEYTYNGIRQSNRNRLLWLDERVDGMKTGHTESAGYCLITSAQQNDMRLISVVLGTKGEQARVSASRTLLDYGFRFFETVKLYSANETLTSMRIWKGAAESVPLGLNEDLYITVPRGQHERLNASMSVDATIVAPATVGQAFGSVDVTLGDQIVGQRPLVALAEVPEGGLWRRLVDNVILLFQ